MEGAARAEAWIVKHAWCIGERVCTSLLLEQKVRVEAITVNKQVLKGL